MSRIEKFLFSLTASFGSGNIFDTTGLFLTVASSAAVEAVPSTTATMLSPSASAEEWPPLTTGGPDTAATPSAASTESEEVRCQVLCSRIFPDIPYLSITSYVTQTKFSEHFSARMQLYSFMLSSEKISETLYPFCGQHRRISAV